MDDIEELEQRRAAKKAERDAVEKEQHKQDLVALEALEEEHGMIAAVRVARFISGQPTRAFIRMPSSVEYKRYRDQIGRAVEKKSIKAQTDAQDLLAMSVWVYPKELRDRQAMLEQFPGLLSSIINEACRLAQGSAEEEGKG